MTEDPIDAAPYTLRFEHRPGYLYACVSGEADSLEISRSYAARVAAECRTHDYRKLLVEEDLKTGMSVMDLYTFASELQDLLSGIEAAFVDRHPAQHSDNLFGETVAVNRGVCGKVFPNVPDAEAWLLSR